MDTIEESYVFVKILNPHVCTQRRLAPVCFRRAGLAIEFAGFLLVLNEGITPAVGEIVYLGGRVLTKSGEPLRNGYIEIWQTDAHGSYVHSGGRNTTPYDSNFQGYGRFITDSKGQYFFRTIKPVEYTLQGAFRCPHIHVAISKSGHRLIATQILVKGHPANERDGLVKRNVAKGETL